MIGCIFHCGDMFDTGLYIASIDDEETMSTAPLNTGLFQMKSLV